jgi:hypothetical protein
VLCEITIAQFIDTSQQALAVDIRLLILPADGSVNNSLSVVISLTSMKTSLFRRASRNMYSVVSQYWIS